MIFQSCDYCGANLDPGERCDCANEERAAEVAPSNDSKRNVFQYQNTTRQIMNQ